MRGPVPAPLGRPVLALQPGSLVVGNQRERLKKPPWRTAEPPVRIGVGASLGLCSLDLAPHSVGVYGSGITYEEIIPTNSAMIAR